MADQIVKGSTGDWEIVIGLEVHAQVKSESKLFSGSATKFGAEPNTQVSLVDAAMPGMLPTLNKHCVTQAIKTGLGLKAEVNRYSMFDRKNYFYPDLPQGYQISQFNHPIVGKGVVRLDLEDGSTKNVGITRVHLEQDAGKSIHDQSPDETFIDLNRSGVALMEIVSDPDIRSSHQACEYVKKLRSILRYLGTCDGDMEKGSMRCDINVSVRKVGEQKYGTRAEIKNVNSIKNIHKAIEFEAARQVELLESGEEVVQETRLFDAGQNQTRSMRSKEEAHDYRYFPDPDLLPLNLSQEFIDGIAANLPELPDEKCDKYINDFKLSQYDASVLVAEKTVAEFFEKAVQFGSPKLVANWITVELFALLNKNAIAIEDSPISPENIGKLVGLIEDGTISGKIAKTVFEEMFASKKDPDTIIEEKGLKQVSDTKEIEKIIDEVISQNADKVAEYKSGKEKLFGFFVGQAMKLSQGKANPKTLNDLLKKKLSA